mmetsp:Transcript_18163/g.28243  ORF Transcript_18163/g.28243 Transcript_18163/m.28243 type:complete len:131 (+) Transcript_18163:136-528(+)|eukprot:CAMPEP_0196807086 /NCGR_PEP_ID=MMETSP1362-20130617/7029_1 /TAXON_ID=163516 /ORGANISM="Leptocylindrus danicus, Strain CCMP1856" /LENGTH=130 /DNA_ID=CAMNT_0042180845 /DNA_START=92 /DNA_END=484 /DNA_ORIENTATION=-
MTGKTAALTLYRSILSAHKRYLPSELRQLGDAYVKSEFRLHKTVTKKEQIQLFFTEWENYLEQIQVTARTREAISVGTLDNRVRTSAGDDNNNNMPRFGVDLSTDMARQMNEEQVDQMNKLREEALKNSR